MANDVRKVEHENKLEQITKQYKPPARNGSWRIVSQNPLKNTHLTALSA